MQTIWPFLAFFLLVIHLLSVQVAGAAPIICCLLPKGPNLEHGNLAGRRLAKHAVLGLIVGVSVGLILGWLAMQVQHQRDYLPALTRFYNRVWWGGWELLFSLVILLAVWLPWNYWVTTKTRKIVQGLLAIIAATNLLYHFPPLLTVMASHLNVGLGDGTAVEPMTSAEFRGLIAQPLVIAKSLHFVFAAVAVSGAWLMLLSPTTREPGDDPARRGAAIAVAAMAVQMLIGMWIVVQVPAAEQSALMGGDPIAAGLLLVSILFSMGSMNQLGTIMMDNVRECTAMQIRSAAIGVLVIATVMICVAGRMSGIASG